VDPIIGVRGQYNFNDKWYVAGNTDIGGFGVSSDITWSVEAVVGYNFTRNVSAELGYRYLYTDYQDGGFIFDMAQAGIYTGVNIRF
jgi:opacity protein-like surface antigen